MKHFFTSIMACAVAVSAFAISPRIASQRQPVNSDASLATVATQLKTVDSDLRVAKKANKSKALKSDKRVSASQKEAVKALKQNGVKCAKKAVAHAADASAEETLLDESFACLKKGSIADPVYIETDYDYNIPEEIIGEANYGFGGEELYEAGEMLYVKFSTIYDEGTEDEDEVYGYFWTPNIQGKGIYTVTFDIKSINDEDATDWVNVYIYDGVDYAGIDLNFKRIVDVWQTVTFEFDGTTAEALTDEIYFMIDTDDYDFVVRNFTVTASFPKIVAPTALPYTDYDGTSMTANWTEADNATGYLLSVAVYDPEIPELTDEFLLEDQPVEGTSYKVTGMTQGKAYGYYVKSTDGENVSSPSNMILMDELPAPKNIKAVIDEEGNIEVTWDEVEGANIYETILSGVYTATDDIDYAIADADFSLISSEGTLDDPEIPTELDVVMPQMPGWTFEFPAIIDGAMGIKDDAIYSWFGYYSAIFSDLLDLSNTEGTVNIEMSVCSSVGSSVVAYIAVPSEDDPEEYEMADQDISDPLTTEFSTISFTLEGGKEASQIVFQPINMEDEVGEILCDMYIQTIKVEVPMKSGDSYSYEIDYRDTEDTIATFSLTPDSNMKYAVTVGAYQLGSDGYLNLASQLSDPVEVIEGAGVENVIVDNDSNAPVEYFDLSGRRVAQPATGLFIVRQGSNVNKVIVK